MRALRYVVFVGAVAGAFAGGYVLRGGGTARVSSESGRKVLYWVDPMHPAYKSDKPGTAPDCGMALEPVYADDDPAPGSAESRKVLYYRDPEDATYTATAAGVNPETGNTLEPVYAEGPGPAGLPAGAFRIPTTRQQLAGVTYATVEATDVGRTLRTVGKVGYDETRLQHVHARVDGWIEQVFADFTGDLVKKGQPMLTIYSPEMLASQEELLLARRARDVMRNNPLVTAGEGGESLFQASRRRLQLWKLSDEQIDQVLETGKPIRNVTLYAPASGFVLERNAFPNQRVTAESDLYTLADLSRVWVMADVYEADLAAIRIGAPARIVLPYGPNTTTIAARVNYVQPAVDPTTRTLKLRLEANNPGFRLRPEMFVNVEFELGGNRQLTVPAEAVLDSGDRQVVFADLGDGYLLPKEVQTAERVGDRVVVTAGLAEGERVVASGTFLIDAESQLKAALATMPGHSHAPPAEKASNTSEPRTDSARQPPAGPAAVPAVRGGHPHD